MSNIDYSRALTQKWWRRNWRVILLVVLLLLSAFALFVGGGETAEGEGEEALTSEGPTNLVYGLELSGGTRVRAPLVGMTADGLAIDPGDESRIQTEVADNLTVDEIDVMVRAGTGSPQNTGTVEVFAENVTREEFATALRQAGFEATTDDIRSGVTEETRSTAVSVLQSKIDESGLAGGTVQQTQTSTGEHFILIEVPNEDRSDVVRLIEERGAVQIVATYPEEGENGSIVQREEVVLSQGDFTRIGQAENPPNDPPGVSVVLIDQAAEEFATTMRDRGFVDEGIGSCNYQIDPDDPGYCLYTVLDGEVVYAANMGPDLAQTIRNEEFTQQPNFRMTTTNMSDARQLRINLQAGSLPAPLDLDRGSTFFIEPSLADDFKVFSLLTGIIAVIAVSFVVYLRYRDVRVAIPMLLTALAEVAVLLGFAAAIRLPLDLAYMAGFIAVIGTGVDDLIIIADEVLSQGEVRTNRVFKNRFRKALWVIGAAAATTIIAMSPLAILSLGDLRGFAIITIIGVLIGVFITRPAYGDILRSLMTER